MVVLGNVDTGRVCTTKRKSESHRPGLSFRLFDRSDCFPKFTNPEVRWLPGMEASFLLLLLGPLICRRFVLLLTSSPVTGDINIRETKAQNAKVATLTSSCPERSSAVLNTVTVLGHPAGAREKAAVPQRPPQQADTACHVSQSPFWTQKMPKWCLLPAWLGCWSQPWPSSPSWDPRAGSLVCRYVVP